MRDLLKHAAVERTESQARVVFIPTNQSGIVNVSGLVRGPYCDFAKTLTADFTVSGDATGANAFITEPCYWSRQLPFWYEAQLTLEFADGTVQEDSIPVSLRRFYCEGPNLRWDGNRVVLRGLKFDAPTEHDVHVARQDEVALIVELPSLDLCEWAGRLGVPLVADMRGVHDGLEDFLMQYAWCPAVLLVLLDEMQLPTSGRLPVYCAISIDANSESPRAQCDIIAVELNGDERPPQWATHPEKPVMAIRSEGLVKIRSARAACDRLQAALAPEFSLAGYFV